MSQGEGLNIEVIMERVFQELPGWFPRVLYTLMILSELGGYGTPSMMKSAVKEYNVSY